MTDRNLEHLIRMVGEIEALERCGPSANRHWPARWTISVAAAAACLLLLVPKPHPQIAITAVAAPLVSYDARCAGPSPRIDHFNTTATATEPTVVLAALRIWQSGCECLAWQLYRWEDGGSLASLDAGEALKIELDVSDSPPIEQLLIVAVARNAADLPQTHEDTEALLACLNNDTVLPPEPADALVLAAAVRDCLPQGVTLVARPFVVE